MRGSWIVVALMACHPAEPPATVAPRGPTPCARASDSMVQVMLDRLSSKGPPPTEEADALRNLIRERCEQDGWSAEATRCLTAMTKIDDAAACAKLMTDEQQAALVRDEDARFPRSDQAAPPAAASGPAPAEAPAAGTPGPAAPVPPASAQPSAATPPAPPPPPPTAAPVTRTAPPAAGAAPRNAPAKAEKAKGKATGDPCSGGEQR